METRDRYMISRVKMVWKDLKEAVIKGRKVQLHAQMFGLHWRNSTLEGHVICLLLEMFIALSAEEQVPRMGKQNNVPNAMVKE
jgi:hypothetical protein